MKIYAVMGGPKHGCTALESHIRRAEDCVVWDIFGRWSAEVLGFAFITEQIGRLDIVYREDSGLWVGVSFYRLISGEVYVTWRTTRSFKFMIG